MKRARYKNDATTLVVPKKGKMPRVTKKAKTTKTTTKRKETNPGELYSVVKPEVQEPSLAAYLKSVVPKTACLEWSVIGRKRCKLFSYYSPRMGRHVKCGGLHKLLKSRFYPKYDPYSKEEKKKYRKADAKVKGSNVKEGQLVDKQLTDLVDGSRSENRLNAHTSALLEFWRSIGHTLHAAQVPVELSMEGAVVKMTKCDVLTLDANGKLWCWEVKCGMPIAPTKEHGYFASAPFQHVPLTKFNIWQLQVYYTAQALLAAGVDIYQYRVIQAFGYDNQVVVKAHEKPNWLK